MSDLIDRNFVLSEIEEEIGSSREYPEDKLIDKGLRIARKLVAHAPAVNRWIPVEDALPEENVRCIVYTEGGGYGISRRMGRNLEKWNCFGLQVTHWMPLPEPPEKE
jgi:hypothetical protein